MSDDQGMVRFPFLIVSQLPTESSSGEHGEVAASCRAWLD